MANKIVNLTEEGKEKVHMDYIQTTDEDFVRTAPAETNPFECGQLTNC
jgi:hypothetical protein